MNNNNDLINWQDKSNKRLVKPWLPQALAVDAWPPNYLGVYAWRLKKLAEFKSNPDLLVAAKAYYSTRPKEFILHWIDTYDPRKKSNKWMPFILFSRQAEFIDFLQELRETGENGLCEKARDMGVTWEAVAYSVHCWLFIENDAIGWGSRKQELVDKLGDASSIFEKIRLIIRRLPKIWLPNGLKPREHLTFMKCINPENGSAITGETGDNIGRGGRNAIYFKDESAHYERPELIEAALGDNTNVQIDISSVNGLNNPFHRRREAGLIWLPNKTLETGYTRVFVMDWRDHPEKTQSWYDTRKARAVREGMQHIFAQEVDRNYAAAVSNTVIPHEWIVESVDAHLRVSYLLRNPKDIPQTWFGGLDVADGGIDRNAYSERQWIIWRSVEEWGERDTGTTARRSIAIAKQHKQIKVFYDAVGIGASIKSEFNRIRDEILQSDDPDKVQQWERFPKFVAWNAGAKVLNPYERIISDDPESLLNRDVYGNLKAQAWFSIRSRFYKTYRAVKFGDVYPADELISLDSSMPLLQQLMKELAQPTIKPDAAGLKTIIEKKPNGAKSPNLADCGIQMFFPVPDDYSTIYVGAY